MPIDFLKLESLEVLPGLSWFALADGGARVSFLSETLVADGFEIDCFLSPVFVRLSCSIAVSKAFSSQMLVLGSLALILACASAFKLLLSEMV